MISHEIRNNDSPQDELLALEWSLDFSRQHHHVRLNFVFDFNIIISHVSNCYHLVKNMVHFTC